ncbi:hypothetical protein F5X96DRAFT_613213 [Biscogniauxia mediterranea]|nr:hypothetical protein F5X96DRAFT_613213 [Biscogniauxia mediterranea]
MANLPEQTGMNLIIAGGTGFVGSEVVRQAIADTRIKHAFVLTRKPLPDDIPKDDKVTVILHDDFSTYPPSLIEKLTDAEACVWSIGGRATQFPDVETARRVSVDFTIAAAKAFLDNLAPRLPDGRKFRFLFCSGKFAEWDDKKKLSFMSDTRHIKGQVEKGLCELADANPDKFEVFIVRPGGIASKGGRLKATSANLVGFITVDHLAKDMLEIVVNGHSQRIVESEVLIKM